jgi:streptogramin lyase
MRMKRLWLAPLIVFSGLALSACRDRLFDNPNDPQAGEVVFEVANSFFGPALAPRGLAWDGFSIWVVDSSNGALLNINPSNGGLLRTLQPAVAGLSGVAYDGTDLWVCGEGEVFLSKINALSGDVVKRLNLQRGSFTALAHGQGVLWAADAQTNKILKIDPETGEVLGSFADPGTRAAGLAFDGQRFWISDDRTLTIYQCGLDGSVLRRYLSPGPSPQGLCHDGRYLWNADGNQKFFQLRFQ